MSAIKFGTSGWRAIIAEEFTQANMQRVIAAIARYVNGTKSTGEHSLVVGYDPRFLSDKFAVQAAEILANHGIKIFLSDGAVPTPAVAYEIRARKTSGGVNFTASHNPAEYNGIKFSMPNGAPALPEVTKEIERQIEAGGETPSGKPAGIETITSKRDILATSRPK
jgi:phosphoglucomutase